MKKLINFVSANKKKVQLEINIEEMERKALDWETLQEVEHPIVLSISGECGGHYGQIYDSFVPTAKQKRLIDLWKDNHLNDMCAGTKKQTEYLKSIACKCDYNNQCKELEKVGLLVDNGYKYGTRWLYKTLHIENLEEIIADIEQEEKERVDALGESEFDVKYDNEKMLHSIEDTLGCLLDEAKKVVAFMRSEKLGFNCLDDITIDECHLKYLGTNYYVGTQDELEDIARDYIEEYLWKEAVEEGRTLLGYKEWVDYVISEEGAASILNSWDGTCNEEYVFGTWYTICRQ